MSRKLSIMLAELEANPLVTILVPSKRALNPMDQIRVNVSVPPRWYRAMCNLHGSKRGVRRAKFDTIIRRQHTIRALERMIVGNLRGRYAERILEAARKLPA